MDTIGQAALEVVPKLSGDFDRQLRAGTSGPFGSLSRSGDDAGKSAGRRFASSFGRAARVGVTGLLAGGALVGAGAFKIGKDALAEASDLNESMNALNRTYEAQSGAVKALGRDAAESLGLSNVAFNNLAVRFSSFSKTIAGGDGPKVVGVLDDLTTRASDFASVMNLDVSQAAELFQSGLAGESEPLRAFGIDLSAATVQAFAYSHGIAESGEQLTQAQKVQATYGSLMKQTAKTQGDFAGTSDQLANSQRILSARWDNAQAKLGRGLLPVVTDAVGYLNREGIPAFNRFADWFNEDGIPAIHDFASDLKPLAKQVVPAVGSALETVRDAVKTAAPYAEDLVAAFNDMPDWAKKALVGGGIAAGVGSKLGLGSLLTGGRGGGGGIGGLISKASPMPVFVTNPGFGPGSSGVPGAGGKPGSSPTSKAGAARNVGRAFLPFALADLAYEGIIGDLFGTRPVPNAQRTTRDVQMTANTLHTPKTRPEQVTFETGGFSKALSVIRTQTSDAVGQLNATLNTLPPKVVTDFETNGIPDSKKEANDLVKKYNLTPRQKETLFKALGIPTSQNSMKEYQRVLAQTPPRKSTEVSLPGADRAISLAHSVRDAINSIPLFRNTVLTTSHGSSGRSSRGQAESSRRSGG